MKKNIENTELTEKLSATNIAAPADDDPLKTLVELDDDAAEPEPKSLLEGMQSILESVKNSRMSPVYANEAAVPLAYLSRRLSLTWQQVTLLAVIMEMGFQRNVPLSAIARYIGVSNIKMLDWTREISVLIDRRLVVEKTGRYDPGYTIPDDVYDAFRRNEPFAHKVPDLSSDDELVERLDRMVSEIDNCDDEKETAFFDHDVRELLMANSKLRLARILLTALRRTTALEFRVLLLMSMMWIRDEEEEVESHRFSIVIKNQLAVSRMATGLQKGGSALIKKKYVTVAGNEGLLSGGVFALTTQFRKSLTPDRTIVAKDEKRWQNRLTRNADISEKQLFYNPETAAEVERLAMLLQPEQTAGILARLRERNLRGGFTCLLYGGPGTGKTETVLQLARRTGRDIFQVDVSQLRTKWYGESERLVKGVFDEYRQMVAKSKVAPIMFFNEADAIFNRRMENAERSVDKSENALQNIILQEMETLDGILIATTNLAQNMDRAFERRFLYKIRFDKPTVEARTAIWREMLPTLDLEDAKKLAERYDFSGGQIENIARHYAIDAILHGNAVPTAENLSSHCDSERISNTDSKRIGFAL